MRSLIVLRCCKIWWLDWEFEVIRWFRFRQAEDQVLSYEVVQKDASPIQDEEGSVQALLSLQHDQGLRGGHGLVARGGVKPIEPVTRTS